MALAPADITIGNAMANATVKCLTPSQLLPGLTVTFHPQCYWQKDNQGATTYRVVSAHKFNATAYSVATTALDGAIAGRTKGWHLLPNGHCASIGSPGFDTPMFVENCAASVINDGFIYCTCAKPQPKPMTIGRTSWTNCNKCQLEIK